MSTPSIDDYDDPLLLSEVAVLLRCSAAHVRAKVFADGLKYVSWGSGSRVKRVFKRDLTAYIESKREAR